LNLFNCDQKIKQKVKNIKDFRNQLNNQKLLKKDKGEFIYQKNNPNQTQITDFDKVQGLIPSQFAFNQVEGIHQILYRCVSIHILMPRSRF